MKRKKILLCSDDITTTSGVAQMSKNIIVGLASDYDWVQLAASNLPPPGNAYDISKAVNEAAGIDDSHVILYPVKGYGNKFIMELILEQEKPDAIIIFTDPRFWKWFFKMEHIIHQKYGIPILYYSIWDNAPIPVWNKGAYASCNALMAINKQTHVIHKEVLKLDSSIKTVDLTINDNDIDIDKDTVILNYVPHGIDPGMYYPITKFDEDYDNYIKFKDSFFKMYDVNRVFFWNNRNITRKRSIDVLVSFKKFCDLINNSKSGYKSDNFLLLVHTNPFDPNGPNLIDVAKHLCSGAKIGFSTKKISNKELNYYYNLSDLTINIANAEGFGLSSAESLMSGTPVLSNVTGGLQDQMGFDFNHTKENLSNNIGLVTKCGKWAFPLFADSQNYEGSQETPFIQNDYISVENISKKLYEIVTQLNSNDLKERGLLGREYLLSNKGKMSIRYMCKGIKDTLYMAMKHYKKRDRIELIKIDNEIRLK